MPVKNTFKNLPSVKQDRILAEAVHEFANNSYRKASLNSLVKRLGIAKGSLYQYFDNKEALYLFIFESFTSLVKKSLTKSVLIEAESDFFRQLNKTLQAGIFFIDHHPEYYQIYLRLLSDHEAPCRDKLLNKVRLFSREYFGTLCRHAQDAGIIRPELSCSVVVFLVESVLDRFLQSYAGHKQNAPFGSISFPEPIPAKLMTNTIDALRNGLCP